MSGNRIPVVGQACYVELVFVFPSVFAYNHFEAMKAPIIAMRSELLQGQAPTNHNPLDKTIS
ncbi:MAG: hypothetical protein ACJ78Q_20120 [Chloroflexia bacterium]